MSFKVVENAWIPFFKGMTIFCSDVKTWGWSGQIRKKGHGGNLYLDRHVARAYSIVLDIMCNSIKYNHS